MKTDCDVLIVGGGLVGLTLACELANAGREVRVLERAQFKALDLPANPGLRVSAINPSSQQLLTQLGVWPEIPDVLRCSFNHMRVWDEDVAPFSDRALEFAGVDFGLAPLGHIVHNDALQAALFERARQLPTLRIVFEAAVDDIVIETGGVRVFTADQSQHTASLIVGADGMRSRVRELCAIKTVQKSYAQKGIVCNIRTEQHHEHTAWQRFLSTGPLALLPLTSGECSIVWSVDDERASQLLALTDAEFAVELTAASDAVLGQIEVASARAAFPLGLLRAERYTSHRVALLGDAAHVVHPLAGQGVNLGFGDVAMLAAALKEGDARGDQIGDRFALRKYERARKYENRKMQLTVDALHYVFASRRGWLQQSRSLGMGLLNQWPTIKGRIAREALGA